jgi:1-deoxyxylulose-5-phosphate synthase
VKAVPSIDIRMEDQPRADPRATGLPGVPRILVGTAHLGNPIPGPLGSLADRREAFGRLDSLIEVGCTAFDLAASYMLGGTERFVGAWLAARGHRDRLYLVTKAGHPYPVLRPNRLSRGALAADLDASLRRLRTDRIDLFLVHRDVPGASLEPLAESLASFVRSGKVLAWGVSNWHHDRIRALMAAAKTVGLPPIAASSPQFSRADWRKAPWPGCVSIAGEAGRQARVFHAETQIPVLAWSPLGTGFLTGRAGGGAYRTAANVARKERALALAAKRGCTPAQVCLAYLFSQPFPVHAIVRATTPSKMRENLQAASLVLSAADLTWLETGTGPSPV